MGTVKATCFAGGWPLASLTPLAQAQPKSGYLFTIIFEGVVLTRGPLYLYDIDGNGYRELIIQIGDDGAFEIYYPLYDGDKVVGALSAGVIPGSEDGTFAYDDEYTLINVY